MSSSRFRRRATVILGCAALVGVTSSSIATDHFVLSGAYASARALAADCSRPFLPMLDSLDRRATADDPAMQDGSLQTVRPNQASLLPVSLLTGSRAVHSVLARRNTAGASLAYDYRTYSAAGAAFMPHRELAAQETWGMALPAGVRIDSYSPDNSTMVTVASAVSGGVCKRLVLKHTATVQVGQDSGAVWLVNRFLEKYQQYNRMNNTTGFPTLQYVPGNQQWRQSVPGINPDTIVFTVVAKVYVDGVPKRDQSVKLWTDARGIPTNIFRTVAHQHIAVGRANDPWIQSSLDIRKYNAPAAAADDPKIRGADVRKAERLITRPDAPVTLKTDGQGETPPLVVSPGFRGGPEAIIGVLQDDPSVTVLSSVMIANMDAGGGKPFAFFAEGVTPTGARPVAPSDTFPFNLVGNSAAVHAFSHYVQRNRLEEFRTMWRGVWATDIHRRLPDEKHYITMNQMSFEYGGATNPARDPLCNTQVASRYSHTYGIDFDLNPCYGGGSNGTDIISGEECLRTNGKGTKSNPHMDDDILVSFIIAHGGVIYAHEHNRMANGQIDNTAHHYHVRFPYRPGKYLMR